MIIILSIIDSQCSSDNIAYMYIIMQYHLSEEMNYTLSGKLCGWRVWDNWSNLFRNSDDIPIIKSVKKVKLAENVIRKHPHDSSAATQRFELDHSFHLECVGL